MPPPPTMDRYTLYIRSAHATSFGVGIHHPTSKSSVRRSLISPRPAEKRKRERSAPNRQTADDASRQRLTNDQQITAQRNIRERRNWTGEKAKKTGEWDDKGAPAGRSMPLKRSTKPPADVVRIGSAVSVAMEGRGGRGVGFMHAYQSQSQSQS